MSDTTSSDTIAEPAKASMGIAQQYIKDFSFESPSSPKIFMSQMKQPEVNANFNVAAEKIGDDIHEVVLSIEINAESDGNPVFVAELAYAGICQIKGTTEEVTKQALMIEVPRLLFPYARAVISEAIRDGGFPPLLLNPVDFNQLYQEHMKASVGQTGVT